MIPRAGPLRSVRRGLRALGGRSRRRRAAVRRVHSRARVTGRGKRRGRRAWQGRGSGRIPVRAGAGNHSRHDDRRHPTRSRGRLHPPPRGGGRRPGGESPVADISRRSAGSTVDRGPLTGRLTAATHNPQASIYDPRPTTHYQRPTTNDPLPTTHHQPSHTTLHSSFGNPGASPEAPSQPPAMRAIADNNPPFPGR